MSVPESLDHLVGELLEAIYAADAAGPRGMRAAAEQDARYRDRYAALTGRRPPPSREIRTGLHFAQVAAKYRRRYGIPDPPDPAGGA